MSRYVARFDAGDALGLGLVLAFIGSIAACIGAWVTHLVWVIGKLAGDGGVTLGQVILGILGLFVPPVGVIHGIMIWFGAGLG